MSTASWIFWAGWIAAGLAWELFAIFTEKKTGALPLTRPVDYLMKRFILVKLGVLLFIAWLALHFLTPLDW